MNTTTNQGSQFETETTGIQFASSVEDGISHWEDSVDDVIFDACLADGCESLAGALDKLGL